MHLSAVIVREREQEQKQADTECLPLARHGLFASLPIQKGKAFARCAFYLLFLHTVHHIVSLGLVLHQKRTHQTSNLIS